MSSAMPSVRASWLAGKVRSIRKSPPTSSRRTRRRTSSGPARSTTTSDMLSVGGIELLPPLPVFLAFALAGLALNIVPGADMTFVIASGARGGRRDGTIAALGIGAGTLVHILAAVLGLSAILATSQTAFMVIKWVGAAYLAY